MDAVCKAHLGVKVKEAFAYKEEGMGRKWGSTAMTCARAEKSNAPTVRIHAEHRKDATLCHNVTETQINQTLHFIHARKYPHDVILYIFR